MLCFVLALPGLSIPRQTVPSIWKYPPLQDDQRSPKISPGRIAQNAATIRMSLSRNASESINVTIELVRRGYSERDIIALWGGNLLRVMEAVERVAKE